METRVVKLELVTEKILERLTSVEQDVAVIRSNYATREDVAKLETAMQSMAAASANYATKAEIAYLQVSIAALETRMLKWFIGTAVTLAGVAFAAGRWIH